jgi:uncharacterized cupin superfamily protein
MADQTVIKYDRNAEPAGLQQWEAYPVETVKSGNPVQNGHTYLDNDNGVFTSGVWDVTPHELVPGPYDVDEMMIVLEGSIIIEHESGSSQRFRAGDSFIIPKGTPCTWRQDEYARKYWAIYDSNTGLEADPDLDAILINADAELPSMGQQDPAMYESEVPEMGMLVLYRDPTEKFLAGVWDSTPMKRKPGTIERSELMHILEGSGSITNADGVVFNFNAGDTFMVPVGMGYQWESHEYVKKIFCSYTPPRSHNLDLVT